MLLGPVAPLLSGGGDSRGREAQAHGGEAKIKAEAGVVLVKKFDHLTSTTPALRARPLLRLRPIGLALRAQLRRGAQSSASSCAEDHHGSSSGSRLTWISS